MNVNQLITFIRKQILQTHEAITKDIPIFVVSLLEKMRLQ